MKYNKEYNRWVGKDGLIYRYDKRLDKLVLCGQSKSNKGYMRCRVSNKPSVFVHRIVWETFNGPIPYNMEIDHKNNNRADNSLDNLQLVTHAQNNRLRFTRGFKATGNKRSYLSEFGKLFFEKYGFSETKDKNLYSREYKHWRKYGCLKI